MLSDEVETGTRLVVYLHIIRLMGMVRSAQPLACRPVFSAGAILAGFLWFTAPGFGAVLLRPVFAKPSAWHVLDAFVGVVMLALAGSLASHISCREA